MNLNEAVTLILQCFVAGAAVGVFGAVVFIFVVLFGE